MKSRYAKSQANIVKRDKLYSAGPSVSAAFLKCIREGHGRHTARESSTLKFATFHFRCQIQIFCGPLKQCVKTQTKLRQAKRLISHA